MHLDGSSWRSTFKFYGQGRIDTTGLRGHPQLAIVMTMRSGFCLLSGGGADSHWLEPLL
jgi:hypothetical protein